MSSVGSEKAAEDEAAPAGGLAPNSPTGAAGSSRLRAFKHYRQVILVGSFVLMIIIFTVAKSGTFLTSTNIQNLINGMPVLTMLAIAVTVVLVLGEFDLSVPNVTSLAAVIIAVLSTQTKFGLIVAIVIGGILVALAAG